MNAIVFINEYNGTLYVIIQIRENDYRRFRYFNYGILVSFVGFGIGFHLCF